jgi:hypothetical protein
MITTGHTRGIGIRIGGIHGRLKMSREPSKNIFFEQLSGLYGEMENAYGQVAEEIGLSCEGCPDNCCNSYFHHHTYLEWAYVWEGMGALSEKGHREFVHKAQVYVEQSRLLLAQGRRPEIMCPLNDKGLCRLYEHRLMICRMHGVPNRLLRPDGKEMTFPGCYRCQGLCKHLKEVPILDRTNLYRKLASLEMAFVGSRIKILPRVNLTLAEMILQRPPEF